MIRKKICIVTGTRAEYGLLKNLMALFRDSSEFELQIIATAMHLSPEFGLTYKEIEKDGFEINKKVEMLLSSDTKSSIAKSMGLGIIGFSDALEDLKPDLVILLGDRFEVFSFSASAMIFRIPIVHIHGGERTEGLIDEAIRHSITKMSYIHFVANEEYKKRVVQLGENPKRVFISGGLGVDIIKSMKLLSLAELESALNFKFQKKNIIVTFHPVTLENNFTQRQFSELLDALEIYLDKFESGVIFTKSNSDTNGRIINLMIDNFVINHNNCISFHSLGQLKYYSVMQYIDAVVGNSSSGLLEAPTFKIGTINIGDRQRGRIIPESVISCNYEKDEILSSINKIYSEEFRETLKNFKNPYGEGGASKFIFDYIKNLDFNIISVKKEFFDIDYNL